MSRLSQMSQKQIEWVRPKLYRKQEAAFFHSKRYGMTEASTKAGKTFGASVWLTERMVMRGAPGRQFWWVAPIFSQSEIVYNRLKLSYPQWSFEKNDSKLQLHMKNGSTLAFKSGDKPDSLYGDDVWDVVIDEASRTKQDSLTAIRSTLTYTGGFMRAIGNVKGRGNWFYKECRRAEAGDPDMHYSKITAYDAVNAGVLKIEEIEDAKRRLPENVFKELYLAEPSDDGGNPFGISAIQSCIGVFSGKPVIIWGIDLAKSYDWTVMVGLDEDGNVAAFHRWQKPWQNTIADIRNIVGECRALVDSTGVGDAILEALQEKGQSNFEGYKFTSQSKQILMEALAVSIQQNIITYPPGFIVTELENFEYEYYAGGVRYSAPDGLHDDCVCALALANYSFRQPFDGQGYIDYYKKLAAQNNQ